MHGCFGIRVFGGWCRVFGWKGVFVNGGGWKGGWCIGGCFGIKGCVLCWWMVTGVWMEGMLVDGAWRLFGLSCLLSIEMRVWNVGYGGGKCADKTSADEARDINKATSKSFRLSIQ